MKKRASNLAFKFIASLFISTAVLVSINDTAKAQDTWTGADAANNLTNWMDATNWQAAAIPAPHDSLVFQGNNVANSNDFPDNTPFNGITFSPGGSFNLAGNPILLSGSGSGNFNGVENFSGSSQTISLDLNLDWGYYIFIGAGAGVTFNGTLSPSTNGVFFFDGTGDLTSAGLALDSTGLISGLGGQGLIFNGSATAPSPTGLATLSGTSIVPYSGFDSLAGGASSGAAVAIPNNTANNINLSSSGAAAFYTAANGTAANTISAAQVGNTLGTATTTLTIASGGVLNLGSNGGIYLFSSDAGNKSCFTVTGGTVTAGAPGIGGTIVIAADGNTSGNQVLIASAISNNASGPVTVITTGPGSVNPSGVSSFTGGLYVSQGQFQGNTTSVGWGPVYVAANATAYLNGGGTYSNNFFISPGVGTVLQTGTAINPGAILLSSSASQTFTGTLTLLGNPVPSASVGSVAGCRLTGNVSASFSATFTNQITGTGTLDFNSGPHADNFILDNTSVVTPNNWQGGLIIEESLSNPSSARTADCKLGTSVNQIPHGPGFGDVFIYSAATSGTVAGSYARLDLNGFNVTINGLNGLSAASVSANVNVSDSGSAASTLTMGDNDASGNFNGTTTDANSVTNLSLVKIGAGTETFSGASYAHHGTTTISAGTLAVTAVTNMPNSPMINVAAGATFDVSALSAFNVGAGQTLTGAGTVNGNTIINTGGAAAPGLTASTIGVLTNNGNVNFNAGGNYIWNISDAAGVAGVGFSQLDMPSGTLSIGATSANPFTIKINGTAANFNNAANQNWVLVQSANAITSLPLGAFNIDASSFGNSLGSGTFSIKLSEDTHSLLLVFTAIAEIPVAGQLVDQTANAGSPVSLTVTAAGAALPATYQWFQDGNPTPLSNGGDPSGSGATITITSSGDTSTLTIGGSGVQDADDAGYTVTVTDNLGNVASSSATLNVVDAPSGPSVAQSGAQPDPNLGAYNSGSLALLAATTSSGTQPFTYTWTLNGSVISGATTSVLPVEISPTNNGNYTVTISNQAGSVTSSATMIGPVTSVPGQMIFEPFDTYAIQNFPPGAAVTWTGVTNLFNQLTGEPSFWTQDGTSQTMVIQPNGLDAGQENQFGGEYPWPGLAGNSINECYWNDAGPNNHLRITTNGTTLFAPGANTNIYFSFILSTVSLGNPGFNGNQDVLAGFCTSNGATAMNYELVSQIISQGAGQYALGILKANGQNGQTLNATNTSPIPNVQLGPVLQIQVDYLIVGCYSVVSGGTNASDDTLSLWINPDPSTFYAAVAPTPNVGPSSFGVKNSTIQDFILHSGTAPASHRITDLRIGTTWASVTPPSAPTIWFYNQIANNAASTNVIIASQNAGNPITSGYQWTFNNGSGPVPVSDTTLPDNAQITGSSTSALTITGVTVAEEGTYSVTGSNIDPAPSDGGATLTGSGSSSFPPPLTIAYHGPNAIVSWPNWIGYTLEETPSLSSPSWTILGAYDPATVGGGPGTDFFQLVAPPSGH